MATSLTPGTCAAWRLEQGAYELHRTVLRKMEKENTEIIYLRGNHDDVLDRFIPIQFEHFIITDEHIHHL